MKPKAEHQADRDIKAGRIRKFKTAHAALRYLHRRAKPRTTVKPHQV